MTPARRPRIPPWRRVLACALLGLYCFANLYPFAWMVSGSLKTNPELLGNPNLIPNGWYPDVLFDTWSSLRFFDYFSNSVFYTLVSLLGILLIFPIAAFAFAKLEFRGRDRLFALFVGVLLIPGITTLVPLVILVQSAGLANTWPGLILPTINGAAAFSIFLLRNYYRGVPNDLFEAAKLDGASNLQIFSRVYLPLSIPALATISVINVIGVWNAYIAPSLLITDRSMFTLPLGLFALRASAVPQWNQLMAGSMIVILPIVVVLIILQRFYVAGIMAGSTKS